MPQGWAGKFSSCDRPTELFKGYQMPKFQNFCLHWSTKNRKKRFASFESWPLCTHRVFVFYSSRSAFNGETCNTGFVKNPMEDLSEKNSSLENVKRRSYSRNNERLIYSAAPVIATFTGVSCNRTMTKRSLIGSQTAFIFLRAIGARLLSIWLHRVLILIRVY